jgi:hypothetical protein
LINVEFDRILNEAAVSYSNIYLRICVEGLERTLKNVSEDSGVPAEIRSPTAAYSWEGMIAA